MRGYENLLECILRLIFRNYDFFSHLSTGENPYLFSVFFRHIQKNIAEYMQHHTGLQCRYPTDDVAALLCNGLLGVINGMIAKKLSRRRFMRRYGKCIRLCCTRRCFRQWIEERSKVDSPGIKMIE